MGKRFVVERGEVWYVVDTDNRQDNGGVMTVHATKKLAEDDADLREIAAEKAASELREMNR